MSHPGIMEGSSCVIIGFFVSCQRLVITERSGLKATWTFLFCTRCDGCKIHFNIVLPKHSWLREMLSGWEQGKNR